MAKYTDHFKFEVVTEVMTGRRGAKAIGTEHGIHYALIELWVASFRQHGAAGITRRRKSAHYPAEFRLKVLEHMWRESLSYRQISAYYDIRAPGVVAQWEHSYHAGGVAALAYRRREKPEVKAPPPNAAPGPMGPEPTREELLTENEYLRAEVAYLKKAKALMRVMEGSVPVKKPSSSSY